MKDNGSDEEEDVYGGEPVHRADDEDDEGDIVGADEDDLEGVRVGVKRKAAAPTSTVDRRLLKR